MEPRILIVDGHPMLREALRFVLAAAGMEQTLEAVNCEDAADVARTHRVDVVLLDITTREEIRCDLLQQIRAGDRSAAILVHSYHDSPRLLSRSFHAGAAGYLVKGEDKNDLILAVRQAAGGDSVWTSEQITRVRQADADAGRPFSRSMAGIGIGTDQAC